VNPCENVTAPEDRACAQAATLSPLIPAVRDETTDASTLEKEAASLNANAAAKAAVLGSIKKYVNSAHGFREWEQIKDVHLILEPFTVPASSA
jgi:hypothetical protein